MGMSRMTPSDYKEPNWEDARVYDWRDYASEWLREVWGSFSAEQARAVAATLDDIAAREE